MWTDSVESGIPQLFLLKLFQLVDGQTIANICEALNVWPLVYRSPCLWLYICQQLECIQWLDQELIKHFLWSPVIQLHEAADIFRYYNEKNDFYQYHINNPVPQEFTHHFSAIAFICMDKSTHYHTSRYEQLTNRILAPIRRTTSAKGSSHLPEISTLRCERILLPTTIPKYQENRHVEWITSNRISLPMYDCIFLIIAGSMLQPAWREFTLAITTLKDILKPHQILIIALTKSPGLRNTLWLSNGPTEFGVQFPLANWRIWCIEESVYELQNWGDIYQWACVEASVARFKQSRVNV